MSALAPLLGVKRTVNQQRRTVDYRADSLTACRALLLDDDDSLPYGDLVIVLSTLLRIRRTLDGAEIDKIIWDFEAHKALAVERKRRADWRKCELAAERFRAACDHTNAVAVPRSAPDRVW